MATKGNSEGYVYFNKQRKRWNAQYSEYDVKTGNIKMKTKSFKTEDEAKIYLKNIMYQKENPLFIEHNGIPICEIMKSNLRLKSDTNQISKAQYNRVSRTIEKLEKTPLGQKNIDDINSNYDHNYEIGIVICHDGRVYMYSAEERINVNYYKLTVEDYLKNGYNEDTAQIEALKELQKKFSIYFKEVTEDDCV